jgi:hypothetical protein
MIEARALDMRQILTLKTVKNIALQYPNKKGQTFENTMMAICMAETQGGKVNYGDKQLLRKGIKKASYGIMQVRLATARFVAKKFHLLEASLLNDIELIKKMMHDNAFNAKIATLYIVWLSEHSKSYFEMVSRYNGGKVNHPYFNKITKYMAYLKPYKL